MKRGRDDGPHQLPTKKPAVGAPSRTVAQPVAAAQAAPAKLTTNDALSYLREVKNRFANDKHVYDTFLAVMKQFKSQEIDTHGVIKKVKDLFRGHPELILGFNTFLPAGYEIYLTEDDEERQARQPVEFDQAINYVNKIKTRFAHEERIYKAFLEILNMYRKNQKTITEVYDEVAVLFQKHPDLLHEFQYFLPDTNNQLQGRARFAPPLPSQSRPVGRVHPGIRVGAPTQGPQIPSPVHKRKSGKPTLERDEEEVRPRYNLQKELVVFDKLKSRMRNKDAYGDLLKCMNLYSQEIISKEELMGLVTELIGRHQDLTNQFTDFLDHCEFMDIDETLLRKLQDANKNEQERQQKLQQQKYTTKPLSEIVAGEADRVTPSYARVPADYPPPVCSGRRTAMHWQVLNNVVASVSSGSEDQSFTITRKNIYEDALFRCEDDRYELDIVLESNASALKRLRIAKEDIDKLEDKSTYTLPADLLNVVHLNAIKRLYGEMGKDIMELLHRNPSVTIPIIVLRMEEKDRELRGIRAEYTEVWRSIFVQHYHRSLDHRSFYFKQQDKKALQARALVADIRDRAEKRRQEESAAKAVSPVNREQVAADLVCSCPDRRVFEDMYEVIIAAINKHVPLGPRHYALELYLKAVEPLFGLPVRKAYLEQLQAEMQSMAEASARAREAALAAKAAAASNNIKEEDSSDKDDEEDVDRNPTPPPAPEATPEMTQPEVSNLGEEEEQEEKSDAEMKDVAEEVVDKPPNSRMYESCLPIAPFAGPQWSDQRSPADKQVLYANENIYLFFRYHHLLYERLLMARKCSVTNIPKPEHEQDQAAAKQRAEENHRQFKVSLIKAVKNEIDMNVFEDTCRHTLGTNSYELFTVDKLLVKLCKQLTSCVQDDQTYRLWELFMYELRRRSPTHPTVYHSNSHTILEDGCYKLEFQPQPGQLTISMVEFDKAEVSNQIEGMLTEELRDYLSVPAATARRASMLFLNRNLSRTARLDQDSALVKALDGCDVRNSLVVKVSCHGAKVSYVLGTEDVLHRLHPCRSDDPLSIRNLRADRFLKWLDSKDRELQQQQEPQLSRQPTTGLDALVEAGAEDMQ